MTHKSVAKPENRHEHDVQKSKKSTMMASNLKTDIMEQGIRKTVIDKKLQEELPWKHSTASA